MLLEQINRVPARRRTTIMLAMICVCALVVGCGGKDEQPPAADQDSSAMVPSALDSAAVDTTAVAEKMADHETLTSAVSGVKTVAVDSLAALRPRAAAPAESVTKPENNPFNRSQVAPSAGGYSLQLGSFRSAANARAQVERIETLGRTAAIEVATLGGQTYHRVVLRGLSNRDEAERLGEDIRSQLGITYLIRQQ